MTRRLLKAGAAMGLGLAAVTAWQLAALPRSVGHPVVRPDTDILVAYHVHTRRSDGTGSVDDVAAAAAAAGVHAVIVTDHGDGTRAADPPRYVSDVLVVDAVEVSTWGGHYVAIGARPSPFPLAGEPTAVVEDVARLGGLGIAAHPGSSKDDLRWRGWDAPFDGLEWLNADSEWRDRPGDLWRLLLTYPWRPEETLASLLDRPAFELREWDRRSAVRPAVGLAAHDAHARLGLRGAVEPYDGWVALDVPGYASMFRTFTNVVRLSSPLSGSAAADASALLSALAAGRVYSIVHGWADSGQVAFTATSAGQTASIGGHLRPAGPVQLVGRVDAPASARSTIVCGGRAVATAGGGEVRWSTDGIPGACRLEVALHDAAQAPWIATNPIYVRPTLASAPPQEVTAPQVVVPLAGSGRNEAWQVEARPGALVAAGDGAQPGYATMRWRLGAGADQFAALRFTVASSIAGFDRLIVRASADRPMRVWVQLRTPADGGRRWGRSLYLDEVPRQITLPFTAFLALDRDSALQVPLDDVSAILLVVDTVHARPGDGGTVTFQELWLAR